MNGDFTTFPQKRMIRVSQKKEKTTCLSLSPFYATVIRQKDDEPLLTLGKRERLQLGEEYPGESWLILFERDDNGGINGEYEETEGQKYESTDTIQY